MLIDWSLDLWCCAVRWRNKVEHAGQQHRLRLEPSLVICVGEYEEDILQDGHEELLEECVGGRGISLSNVRDQFETHVESCKFYFAIVMLACPHTRVNYKLELSIIKLEKSFDMLAKASVVKSNCSRLTRETMKVDGTEKAEELDAVFWELGKVFVDHF